MKIDYKCSQCLTRGVKLWRQMVMCATQVDLLCVDCAGEDQHRDVSKVDAAGMLFDEYGFHTDQIGNLILAVPTDDNETFWGYTGVPAAGVAWWRALPLRKAVGESTTVA